jgi:thioesterase domain-containing protein
VAAYRQLARHLGSERPFYGLQAMGIDTDQEPQSSVEEMAAWYLDAILQLVPRGPYHLGGWSFGALVAFEMARQLRQRGEEVATLVICDTPAPGALPENDEDESEILARLATDAGLPVFAETLRQLNEEDRLLHLAGLAVQAGFLPEKVAIRHLRRRYHVYKATHMAARRYRPGAYDRPITLLRAALPINEEVARFAAKHPEYGWERFAPAVAVHEAPGTHLSLMEEPQVRKLADVLQRILETPDADHPS